jgi:hypothetical protein
LWKGEPVGGAVEVEEIVEVGDEAVLPLQGHVLLAKFRRKRK